MPPRKRYSMGKSTGRHLQAVGGTGSNEAGSQGLEGDPTSQQFVDAVPGEPVPRPTLRAVPDLIDEVPVGQSGNPGEASDVLAASKTPINDVPGPDYGRYPSAGPPDDPNHLPPAS